jgi:zinc/manganese transport system substrate-binding protein
MKKTFVRVIMACLLVTAGSPAVALQIVTCEQHWAQLAAELGGDHVTTQSLLGTNPDPHHISPTLRALLLVRTADVLICNDVQDEPRVRALLARSQNANVQPGRVGYVEASAYVPTGAVKQSAPGLARRHVHSDPHNILLVAKVLSDRFAQLDQENAREYRARYDAFSVKWNAAIREWERKAIPLRNIEIIEQRQSCAYLCRWLGIREVASLESSRAMSGDQTSVHTALKALARGNVRMIVRGPYHSSAAVTWLQRQKNVPVAVVRTITGDRAGIAGLYSMFDDAISRMLTAASRG